MSTSVMPRVSYLPRQLVGPAHGRLCLYVLLVCGVYAAAVAALTAVAALGLVDRKGACSACLKSCSNSTSCNRSFVFILIIMT